MNKPLASAALQGKRILITGATGGIGQWVAKLCHESGADVMLQGRDTAKLDALCATLTDRVKCFQYDVTDEHAVKRTFAQIQSDGLDGLVNCAGIMQDSALAMTRLQSVREQFDVNAVGSFLHLQLASRIMMRKRAGSIVNLSSAVGEQGSGGQIGYAMSKAAVTGMTKSAAKELAPFNIRVNAVAPGFIDTDLVASYSEGKRAQIFSHIPLVRAGEAKEVADLISFLLSDHAAYITGQIIGIDGGMRL
ncbi:SDR family NAD(P)-dependent oxidoreductase [Bowmanella denitrificans]|uniref:SDR family NAD(P)-dependent oxidoreductase n=1 Tax=Bowmanella denitrificans TaxID=366582 RepID=UPI000C9CBECC|nr:SDR family NAD(P)-dependent oxidoreductase [Bowmanella denitrificans]